MTYAHPDRVYPFTSFIELIPPPDSDDGGSAPTQPAVGLPLAVAALLPTAPQIQARVRDRNTAGLRDQSESAVDFAIAALLSRAGIVHADIEAAIRWSWARHSLRPKQADYLKRTITKASERDARAEGAPEVPGARPRLVYGRDVEVARLEWLWPGYLPLGKASELVGDPNLGKSMIAIDLAARVSAGVAWPDGSPNTLGPRNVLYMSGEDAIEDTLLPRFLAAGGDANRVAFLSEVDEDGKPPLTLKDLDALEEAMLETKPALVIVDVLNAFLGLSRRRASRRGPGTDCVTLFDRRLTQVYWAGTG